MLPLVCAGMMPGFLFPMPIPTPDYPPPEAGDAPADGAGAPGEDSAAGEASQSLPKFGSVCHELYGPRTPFDPELQFPLSRAQYAQLCPACFGSCPAALAEAE